MRHVDDARVEALDRDECLVLLSGEKVGRLGVNHGGAPKIYPVNFALDGDQIVFRSDPDTKISAGLRAPVCFEADRLNRDTRRGWSVVVSGRLEEALPGRRQELERLLDLPLEAWAGSREHLFRVVPQHITGRRVGPVDRSR